MKRVNLVRNGDFQSAAPFQVELSGAGAEAAGVVNTYDDSATPALSPWVVKADQTDMPLVGDPAAPTTLEVATVVLEEVGGALGQVLPAEVPGTNAVYARVDSEQGAPPNGAGCFLTITQTIPNAPRAASGKECLLSFWVGAEAHGWLRCKLSSLAGQDLVATPLIDEKIWVAPGWTQVRREFTGHLVAAGDATSYELTFTLDSTADGVSIRGTGALAITGVYLGVPVAVDGFDDAERLLE